MRTEVHGVASELRSLRTIACLSTVLIAACGGESTGPPGTATTGIRIATASSGVDADPDGYLVQVDGGPPERVAIDTAVTRPLSVGSHSVALAGLSSNCSVDQATRSVSVVAGAVADVRFSITCSLRRIAFTSNRAGNGYQIYVMNRDGSNITQLTTGISDFAGAWSPDGATLLFTGNDATGRRQVFVVSVDGSNRRQLTSTGTNYSGSFSPDGRLISFTSDRDTPSIYQIYLMSADGGSQRRLTASSASKDNPQWSPDGTQLAYTTIPSQLDPGFYFDAYTIKVDGTGEHQILPGVTDKRSPSWAPDGKSIVLVQRPGPLNDRNRAQVVWNVPMDGTAPRQLTFNT